MKIKSNLLSIINEMEMATLEKDADMLLEALPECELEDGTLISDRFKPTDVSSMLIRKSVEFEKLLNDDFETASKNFEQDFFKNHFENFLDSFNSLGELAVTLMHLGACMYSTYILAPKAFKEAIDNNIVTEQDIDMIKFLKIDNIKEKDMSKAMNIISKDEEVAVDEDFEAFKSLMDKILNIKEMEQKETVDSKAELKDKVFNGEATVDEVVELLKSNVFIGPQEIEEIYGKDFRKKVSNALFNDIGLEKDKLLKGILDLTIKRAIKDAIKDCFKEEAE